MHHSPETNLALLVRASTHPRAALRRVWQRGFQPTVDRIYSMQAGWTKGALPRTPVTDLFPQSVNIDVTLLRPADRVFGTSVTIEELCCLIVIAKSLSVRRVLEIGTWNGNTALNLAVNTSASITTLDLSPNASDEKSSVYERVKLNLTDRAQLGRQFKGHELEGRIRQVYGDSASLDWGTLGAPFDLVFIDGCHAEPYVRSDTANALRHLEPDGAIVWHDYGMIDDVSKVVDEIARVERTLMVHAIEGTRLAVAVRNAK